MINLTWSLWTQTSLTKLHFIPHWIHKIAVHIIRSYSPMLSTIFDRISALGKMGMGERPGKEIGKQFKSLQFAVFCYSLHIPVIQFKFPMKVPVKVTFNYSGNSCFIIFRIERQEFLFLWGYAARLWRKLTWPYHIELRKNDFAKIASFALIETISSCSPLQQMRIFTSQINTLSGKTILCYSWLFSFISDFTWTSYWIHGDTRKIHTFEPM